MRMHIEIDDDLIRRVDRLAGPRGRSKFVRDAILSALEQAERWKLIRSSQGSIAPRGHDWDDDPAEWVRAQRFADQERVG